MDPDTEPGDPGTEEWSDPTPEGDDPDGPGPLADPIGRTTVDDVIAGSPAEEFITNPDAIDRRDEG